MTLRTYDRIAGACIAATPVVVVGLWAAIKLFTQ